MKVYEYVETTDWMDGLDKGTRLYYDYDQQGYVYHYERESTNKSYWCESKTFTTEDFFVTPLTIEAKIRSGHLKAGPDLGELEIKK